MKRYGGETRDGVPCRCLRLDRLGHEIDFAGCEDVRIDHAGQILDGNRVLGLKLARMRVFGNCDPRIEDAERDVIGRLAYRVQGSVGHVARDDCARAQHAQRNVGGN